jgi:N-methylhydantoinase A
LKSEKLDAGALHKLVEAFHRRHKDNYGYDMRDQPVEIVNLRLVVTGTRKPAPVERAAPAGRALKSALLENRQVWFPETGYVATPVYDRDRLPAETRIAGPAVIEQMDTTTIAPPGATLTQDPNGYVHMAL